MKRAFVKCGALALLIGFSGGSACERAPEHDSSAEPAAVASPSKSPPASAEPEEAAKQTEASEQAELPPPARTPERASRPIPKEKPQATGGQRGPSPEDAVGSARDTLDRDLARAEAALVDAWREFERAEEELKASGSDCERACRALGSMERSAARICVLEPATQKGSRCPEAQQKLAKAREQVSASCGPCAD